jgi:hypothetical protein
MRRGYREPRFVGTTLGHARIQIARIRLEIVEQPAAGDITPLAPRVPLVRLDVRDGV